MRSKFTNNMTYTQITRNQEALDSTQTVLLMKTFPLSS